jgi:hypothetical protein
MLAAPCPAYFCRAFDELSDGSAQGRRHRRVQPIDGATSGLRSAASAPEAAVGQPLRL